MSEPRDEFVEPEVVKHEEKVADVTAQPTPIGSGGILSDDSN